MARYTVILATDQARTITETVAPVAKAETWPTGTPREVTLALPEAAVRHLETLPSDADGHVDSDGELWIDGYGYPLSVIHNA